MNLSQAALLRPVRAQGSFTSSPLRRSIKPSRVSAAKATQLESVERCRRISNSLAGAFGKNRFFKLFSYKPSCTFFYNHCL